MQDSPGSSSSNVFKEFTPLYMLSHDDVSEEHSSTLHSLRDDNRMNHSVNWSKVG